MRFRFPPESSRVFPATEPGPDLLWRDKADSMEAASEHRTTELHPFESSRPRRKLGVIKELSLQTTTEETMSTEDNSTEATEHADASPELGLSEIEPADRWIAPSTSTPSPIQARLIPAALAGRDCLGNAPTGTGKTAAFLLPILEKIDERERRPQALILAPTRELVTQIGREFERLSFGRRVFAVAVVGGESIVRQQRLLGQGCQVVVATPGRLMDLMSRQRHPPGQGQGGGARRGRPDARHRVPARPSRRSSAPCPTEGRQTLLLSATMPKEVRELANTYLSDPEDVRLITRERGRDNPGDQASRT